FTRRTVYGQVYRNLTLGLCQRIGVSPEDTRNPHGDSLGQASRAMPNFRLLHSHRGMAIWRNVRTARLGSATKQGGIRCFHRAAPVLLGQSWGIKQGYG